MKKLILSFLLITTLSYAQEDKPNFLKAQRTDARPFSLPVSINQNGNISLGSEYTDLSAFQPSMLFGFEKVRNFFSRAVRDNEFKLVPVSNDLGWIEVKRLKIEAGLGLSTLLQSTVELGLIPYKGAINTVVDFKRNKDQEFLGLAMPKSLSQLDHWDVEDSGHYQTYGGVSLFAGVNAGVFDVVTGLYGFQNKFSVEMRKISTSKIKLIISEEDSKRKQLAVGPAFVNYKMTNFNGSLLRLEFTLDRKIPLHHKLFEDALKGKLDVLQKTLPQNSQKLAWTGNENSLFYGIPLVLGRIHETGNINLTENDQESQLAYSSSRNRGILSSARSFQDYVYQTSKGIALVWASEISKTNGKTVEKRFVSKGRILGATGFDLELENDLKLGSVNSQLAFHMNKNEISQLAKMDLIHFSENLRMKCEEEELPCRDESKAKGLVSKLETILKKPWNELKSEIGLLLLKEPILIQPIVKTLSLKKEVYFKFLCENFQSLEGSSLIQF